MKATGSQKAKIGFFTGLGIVLLIAGIYIIGKKKNIFGDTFHIYGVFSSVGGLQQGNNIRYAGINVGTVEDISIISDTMIRVDMVLQNKIRRFIKTTSFATIGSDGLMGDKLLSITAGDANSVQLANGGRIITINPLDFEKSILKLTKVAANAEIISGALADITVQIKDGKGSMGRLLYHDDLARGLEGTIANAQHMTGSLASISGDIKSGKGSLGRLLYTDTLANRLEGTAQNAKITMATVNDAAFGFSENMKALSNSFLFRGYFKKKAKKEKLAQETASASDSTEVDFNDAELAEIEAAAQKTQQDIIDRKKKSKEVQQVKTVVPVKGKN